MVTKLPHVQGMVQVRAGDELCDCERRYLVNVEPPEYVEMTTTFLPVRTTVQYSGVKNGTELALHRMQATVSLLSACTVYHYTTFIFFVYEHVY